MAQPRKISVFDFETDPFDGTTNILPFTAGYYDGQKFEYFWGEDCAYDIANFLCERREICYAHNGGKFDFYYLLPWANRDLITVINGRISQMSIGRCLLRDSFLLYPLALANYKKDDIEYWKMKKKYREKYRDEIILYMKTDCESLYEIVTGFIDRFGRQMTMATASMKELRKSLLPDEIVRLTKDQDELYRPFYFGGRCQAFEHGEFHDDYKVYDINSAYPKAMTQEHPDPCNSFVRVQSHLPNDTNVYFAEIKAKSKGALPYKYDNDTDNYFISMEMINNKIDSQKLFFPNDDIERTYYATGYEIQAGLDTKTLEIIKINKVYVPVSTRSFSGFINRFWQERFKAKKEGDKLDEDYCKLIMNSSYGKFALNPRDYRAYRLADIGIDPNKSDDTVNELGYWELESSWPSFGLDIYKRPDPNDAGFYNVMVAASITGWVRAFLWRTINQCKGVIYCDTDSIVCKEFSGDIGLGLGQWKYEHTVNPCFIAGKKLYAFYYGKEIERDKQFNDIDEKRKYRWKLASKGVRLVPRDIAEIASSDTVIVWFSEAPVFSLKFGQRTLQRDVKQTF